MKNVNGFLLISVFSAVGLMAGLVAIQRRNSPKPYAGSGTLPDVPGLRAREAIEPGFIGAFLRVVEDTGADGDKLAALISEESGFNPQARNPNGATGFLQWLPRYAPSYTGHTVDEIYQMSGIAQLEAVKSTILKSPGYKTDPAIAGGGWKVSLPDDAVVLQAGTSAYAQNKVYDRDGKGYVTAGDVRSAVYGRLDGVGRLTA